VISGRSLSRRDGADIGEIASVDGAPTGRVQPSWSPSVAGRRRSGGDKKVIEGGLEAGTAAGEWGARNRGQRARR
jgi:hypothetical protein